MSIRISAVTLAIAAIIVIITLTTFVVSPQLAYSQQTSSANLNFQTWEIPGLLYKVQIPTNWDGPAWLDAGQTIRYFQSPDKSQTIMLTAYNHLDGTFEQFVENQLKSISSSRGQPLQYAQRLWDGTYPAIGFVFPNYATFFIQANGLIYNFVAQGAVLNNNQIFDPTILHILASFDIYTPEMWAAEQSRLAGSLRGFNEAVNDLYGTMTRCIGGYTHYDNYRNTYTCVYD